MFPRVLLFTLVSIMLFVKYEAAAPIRGAMSSSLPLNQMSVNQGNGRKSRSTFLHRLADITKVPYVGSSIKQPIKTDSTTPVTVKTVSAHHFFYIEN
uniref:Secreted protein n=1 Tax=Panagrellus redivivus TaxID=6233 RepID=A0A7E4VK03_PANRE